MSAGSLSANKPHLWLTPARDWTQRVRFRGVQRTPGQSLTRHGAMTYRLWPSRPPTWPHGQAKEKAEPAPRRRLQEPPRLPAEWFGPGLKRRFGDAVWRVRRRGGGSLIVAVEFQRKRDPKMPLRHTHYLILALRTWNARVGWTRTGGCRWFGRWCFTTACARGRVRPAWPSCRRTAARSGRASRWSLFQYGNEPEGRGSLGSPAGPVSGGWFER